ncbi:hypothetical protein BXZ70DRAFT_933934 [Cristinia sonorae]|uniref:Uncharacterized protein n=1 Tax=Cristinia sonorae TaxID=1940300 RepID=A0A8K0USD7_9AGAR|nr:hypothetical protein BXZ70DRAFT_933934 [Cristinia sonorae]
MSQIPPEYAQTHKDLQNAIDNPVQVPEDQLIRSLASFTATLASSQSESNLAEEIDRLAGSTLIADAAFDRIRDLFNEMRGGTASPSLKADIDTLRKTWSKHRDTYSDLLWESRTAAGKARAAADDFAKDFATYLSDMSVSVAEKKREISRYQAKLEHDGQTSSSLAQAFLTLKTDINTFQEEWRRIVKKHDLNIMVARIAEIDGEIATLQNTLADLGHKIDSLTSSLNAGAGSSGVLGILGWLSPIYIIGNLLGLIGGSSGASQETLDAAKAEKDDVQRKIARLQEERRLLSANIPTAKMLESGLAKSDADLHDICSRLSSLGTVWGIIRADLQSIKEKLDYVGQTESVQLFQQRLNTAAKLYDVLGKALYRYERAVNLQHPMFASKQRA